MEWRKNCGLYSYSILTMTSRNKNKLLFFLKLFAYEPNHTRQHKFCGRHKIISTCCDLDEKKKKKSGGSMWRLHTVWICSVVNEIDKRKRWRLFNAQIICNERCWRLQTKQIKSKSSCSFPPLEFLSLIFFNIS